MNGRIHKKMLHQLYQKIIFPQLNIFRTSKARKGNYKALIYYSSMIRKKEIFLSLFFFPISKKYNNGKQEMCAN